MSGFAARALTWGVVLASLCGLIWLLVGWLELQPLDPLSPAFQPDLALHQATLTHYADQGRRQWSLTARTIAFDEEARTTVAEEVEVRFWQEGGDSAPETLLLSVQAERLVLDNVRQNMRFEGTLSASDGQGLRFVTRGAHWNQQERVLEGEEPVAVQRGDLSLEGTGFRYDAQTDQFLLKGQARLRWVPEERQP